MTARHAAAGVNGAKQSFLNTRHAVVAARQLAGAPPRSRVMSDII